MWGRICPLQRIFSHQCKLVGLRQSKQVGVLNPRSQEQQATTRVDGEEDVWVKDPGLGVDFWEPMAETSGSSVRCLLPSRDGGWGEPTGDMGTSRAEGHGSGGTRRGLV